MLTEDPDDNKFVDVAVAAGADYLVSNDLHLLPLLQLDFPKVPLVSLSDFLAVIQPP